MTEGELVDFIRHYNGTDLDRIRFDWNGQHGDKLRDLNMDFRMAVCEYLAKDLSVASDHLIRDLYLELSKSSKETWGIYRNYHLFAQELLDRGVTKYLMDYLNGAAQSFDTALASGRVAVTDGQRTDINGIVQRALLTAPDSRTQGLLELAIRRFGLKKTDA